MEQVLEIKEFTKDLLGDTATVRANSTRGEEVIKIALDKIVVRDNFNVRQNYGNLEELAYSMIENGQVMPGHVDVLADGRFVLTDGHRRFKALKLLAEMGHEPLFKAIVNPKKMTEEQRILQVFTTQDNKPLEPNEVAELINRLINLGYKQTDVAKRIGRTGAYVSQMLNYVTESPLIKEEVKEGNISVAAVLDLQKKIPNKEERVKAVKDAVAKKKEETKDDKKPTPVSANEVIGKKDKGAIAFEIVCLIEQAYSEELEGADLKMMVSIIKGYL